MSILRTSLVAAGVLGAVMSVSAARASTVAFDDVGFGNLTGPLSIDGNTATVTASLSKSDGSLSVVDSVAETFGGNPFTLTQHGSQLGAGNAYLAGFTFNLGKVSDIAVTSVTPGVSYVVVKNNNGLPLPPGSYPALVSGIGTTVGSYANLSPGKYTLLLEGVISSSGSSSVSATISAVPLPGALVMFGSALIGLTAFGARRRAGSVA